MQAGGGAATTVWTKATLMLILRLFGAGVLVLLRGVLLHTVFVSFLMQVIMLYRKQVKGDVSKGSQMAMEVDWQQVQASLWHYNCCLSCAGPKQWEGREFLYILLLVL